MHSKFQYLAPFLLLLCSKSHAQDLSNLPSCAQSPALSAIGSTGCQANDFACLCKDNSFINAALAGAEKQCSQTDLQKVIAFAQQICGSAGVSLSISASAEGSSVPSPITNTPTPTPVPSPATTSTQVSQSGSSSSSAVPAATTAASQASGTGTSNAQGTASSGASGWDARSGLRGMMWSGAVVGWWLFGVGA